MAMVLDNDITVPTTQNNIIKKYIQNTDHQLKQMNHPDLNNSSMRSSNAENYNPLGESSPLGKQIDHSFRSPFFNSPPSPEKYVLDLDNSKLSESSPMHPAESNTVRTEDIYPPSSQNSMVSKNNPQSLPTSAASSNQASNLGESMEKPKPNLKYRQNQDFNQRSPEQPLEKTQSKTSLDDSWMPDILKNQNWNDSSNSSQGKGVIEVDQRTHDPYLSFDTNNTVIQNSKANIFGSEEADYKKHLNKKKNKEFENKLGRVRLPPLTNPQLIPDTFQYKHHNRNINNKKKLDGTEPAPQSPPQLNKTSDSETPGSPLKLFDLKQDTFTKNRFQNLLNLQQDPEESSAAGSLYQRATSNHETLEDFLAESDNLFQSVVTRSSNLNLRQSQSHLNLNNIQIHQDQTNDNDYTSDSEQGEFESIIHQSSPVAHSNNVKPKSSNFGSPSFLKKEGDQLLNNFRDKFRTDLFPNSNNAAANYSGNSTTFSSQGGDVQYQTEEYTSMPEYNSSDSQNRSDFDEKDGQSDESRSISQDTRSGSGFDQDSPSIRYSNTNINESLDVLQQNLNFGSSVIRRPRTIDDDERRSSNVMVPKIKAHLQINNSIRQKEDEFIQKKVDPKKINFISGEDYKGMVFVKSLKKYVPEAEYLNNFNQGDRNTWDDDESNSADEKNKTFTFDEISSLGSDDDENDEIDSPIQNNRSILKKDKEITKKKSQEVSFQLPKKEQRQKERELTDISNISNNMSFSESKSQLVDLITELYPDVVSWDEIKELNVSSNGINNLEGLSEFIPHLQKFVGSNNELRHLKGIPLRCVDMDFSYNQLNNLTSFRMFNNLQYLNLSHNTFESLENFAQLVNLRSLNISHNKLRSINSLEKLESLIYLDLSNNKIRGELNFHKLQFNHLEYIDLSHNRISKVCDVIKLQRLRCMNLDNNPIQEFTIDYKKKNGSLSELGIVRNLALLKLSSSKLKYLDLKKAVNLKELHIDNNPLLRQVHGISVDKIKTISIKCSSGGHDQKLQKDLIKLSCRSESLQRLQLNGNKMFDISDIVRDKNTFSNLLKLDLSAMNITSNALPSQFARFFPMVRSLNLNFNKLNTLKQLKGLKYLSTLQLLSNNIEDIDDLISSSETFRHSLKVLDIRVNPVNKGYHPLVFADENDESQVEGDITNTTFGTDIEESGMDSTHVTNMDESMVLEKYEDIEAFHMEYVKRNSREQISEFTRRNVIHMTRLANNDVEMFQTVEKYYNRLILWFDKVQVLDGSIIDKEIRKLEKKRYA